MNNPKQNNKSNLPLVIIGLVLIAAIGGGWWMYSRSKASPVVKSNTNNASPKRTPDAEAAQRIYNEVALKAPGAQPANTLGAPAATVVVEEFADFQCPTCATVHAKMKEINSLYAGRIKFIYRNFPLTQIHKNAYEAAIASEAAGAQGKFWAMQDQLYTNQKEWANSAEARKLFEGYAGKIGLDMTKFQTDLAALPTKTRVDNDLARGQALKLTGTPSIFINGKELAVEQMEVNTMRQFIDAELRKSSGQTQTNQPASQTSPANIAVNQSSSGSNVNK
jgi:protein-disulfide isomerase